MGVVVTSICPSNLLEAVMSVKVNPESAAPQAPLSERSLQYGTLLLDAAMKELQSGRSVQSLQRDFVREQWTPAAARRFAHIANQLVSKRHQSSEYRGELAHRGWDQILNSWMWVGAGIVAANMTYAFLGSGVPFYISLFIALWGSFDFVSGFLLWFPHREHYQAYKPLQPNTKQ